MSAFHDNALIGASGQQGYNISRSVRLRSSASAYFNRTNASSPTNAIKWTWSGWVKRGSLGAQQNLVGATNSGSDDTYFNFNPSDKIVLGSYTGAGTDYGITTVAVFRDPSAWYHVVAVLDTANATSADRAIIYVNGVRQTVTNSASGMWPQNATNNKINTASQVVNIGRRSLGDSYLDGYLTEINFVDGQALTPTSFGQFNSVTGVWQPLKYTGTYGTNGFYLNFSDNSNNTAATIGKDYSGNGNNWTPNNISVTSGVTYDSMIDTPTPYADGGNGRGNYAVLNRLSYSAYGSCSDGNLKFQGGADWGGSKATIAIPATGKWYAEFTLESTSSNSAQADVGIFPYSNTNYYDWTGSYGLELNNGFFLVTNGSYSTNRGSTTAGGTVLQVAVDADAGKVWFGVGNAWYDTYNTTNGNPSAGTNPSGSGINFLTTLFGIGVKAVGNNWQSNFGQRPFSYTPPTGFKALNTQNLPEPTIKKGNQYFDATTYTGTGAAQSIVNSGAMQPDFVWMKSRSAATDHGLYDAVRGVQLQLESNTTTAETTETTGLTAFTSTGFTVGALAQLNTNTATYVAWQWKESASAGFDIVTYTGNGTNRTIAHSLGVAPSMIIIKCRDSATDPSWIVGHTGIVMGTGRLILNGTDANSNAGASSLWNSTAANSSVFSLGTYSSVNQNTLRFVAYLFAAVAGYSKFGSYTGNGSADGPFVFCGFRPAFIMIKRTDTTGNWTIHDNRRSGYNGSSASKELYPNLSNAEGSDSMDQLSNGFKLRDTYSDVNASGGTYIYAAFSETAFRNALAR